MALNNLMPPVQLKRPAAPVTDINKMIEDLNLQLTTPTVQQAAPQSANSIAELLKQQIAEKLNLKIESLTQGAPIEEVTGQRAKPEMPVANRRFIKDDTPVMAGGGAGLMAFAKTAQTMNNIKAQNEADNAAREYQQYRDDVDINKMIERLDMKNQYDRALESDRAQNRIAAQDAAFEDRMALLNARLEGKQTGGGRSPGRPSSTGAAAVTSDLNQLDAFLLQNGYTQDELDVLTTKQKQAKVGQVAGRQEKPVSREEVLRRKASLVNQIENKKMYGQPASQEDLELLAIYDSQLSGAQPRAQGPAETGRGRAFNLLLKGSSGAPETLPQTAPAGTPQTLPQRTDSTGNPTLTTDDIIKIINATQNQNGAQPKIKFNPNAGF